MKKLEKLKLRDLNLLNNDQLKTILGGDGGYTVVTCTLNESGTACDKTGKCEVSKTSLPGGYEVIKWGSCSFSTEDDDSTYTASCKCK
jgi:natural product precursor